MDAHRRCGSRLTSAVGTKTSRVRARIVPAALLADFAARFADLTAAQQVLVVAGVGISRAACLSQIATRQADFGRGEGSASCGGEGFADTACCSAVAFGVGFAWRSRLAGKSRIARVVGTTALGLRPTRQAIQRAGFGCATLAIHFVAAGCRRADKAGDALNQLIATSKTRNATVAARTVHAGQSHGVVALVTGAAKLEIATTG
jgi:hypothetical protein